MTRGPKTVLASAKRLTLASLFLAGFLVGLIVLHALEEDTQPAHAATPTAPFGEALKTHLADRDAALASRSGLIPTALNTHTGVPMAQAAVPETDDTTLLPSLRGETALWPALPDQPAGPRARIETFTVKLSDGDTLMQRLLDSGASRDDANAVVRATSTVKNPRHLRAGQPLHLIFLTTPVTPTPANLTVQASFVPTAPLRSEAPSFESQLVGVRMKTDVDSEVVVSRDDAGAFSAEMVQLELDERLYRVQGTIRSSLFRTARDLDVPNGIIAEFVQILAYAIDFSREIRAGDSFEIFYSQYVDDAGRPVKAGDIAFLSMTNAGRTRALYRFEAEDGVDYFDDSGQSVRQFLMRTPVDAARISSRFGRRFHPIQKRWKAHNGVDFAAPTGTRIYAAGNGVIDFAGTGRGYGNYIRIRHSNGYETRYAHMSRFATGIRKGRRVRQGDLIGYVGSTGWSTGPHLHYEVRTADGPVDPLSVRVPTGRSLTGSELASFEQTMATTQAQMAAMPLITQTQTALVSE